MISIFPSPTINTSSNAIVDAGNSTTTPLAGGGVFTGTAIDMLNYSTLRLALYADKPSATNGLQVQFSNDGANWDFTRQATYLDAGTSEAIVFNRIARYARLNYINGAVAQTVFRCQTLLVPNSSEFVRHFMDEVPGGSDTGIMTQSVLCGKTTAGGGGYVAVKVNPSGSLSADVSGSTVDASGSSVTASVTGTVGITGQSAKDISPTQRQPAVDSQYNLQVSGDEIKEMRDTLRSIERILMATHLTVSQSYSGSYINPDDVEEFLIH